MNLAQTEDDRRRERTTALVNAYNPFLSVVEKQRPFIAEEIYKACIALLDVAQDEHWSYQYDDPHEHKEYWKESEANAKKIGAMEIAICEQIRRRIGSMNVVDTK